MYATNVTFKSDSLTTDPAMESSKVYSLGTKGQCIPAVFDVADERHHFVTVDVRH